MTNRTESEEAIERFRYELAFGRHPSAEVMDTICQCFERYLSAKGSISLDEAFFGTAHGKRASYAHRKANDWKYRFFDQQRIRVEKLDLPDISLEKIAMIHLGDATGVPAFLQGYFRWKRSRTDEE